MSVSPLERLTARKARVTQARERAKRLLEGGATGIQVAASISEGLDAFTAALVREELEPLAPADRERLEARAAVIAVGGTGRGELAPYSDCDLLFLSAPAVREPFGEFCARAVRGFWDAGVKLGHSIRTPGESLAMARQDPQIATSLIEARRLWGSPALFESFRRKFWSRVVRARRRSFINDCIRAREEERAQHGSTVQQLEPDIKRSLGGLRDVHLIRWVGFARYGTPALDALRLKGAFGKDDARALLSALEFLTRIRIELHFRSGRAADVLTREAQLWLAEQRGVEATAGQRAVERFMQTYFRHSSAIAHFAQRFVALHRPRTLVSRAVRFVVSHRSDGMFLVGTESIDVLPRWRRTVTHDLEHVLWLFRTAALYGVAPTPQLTEQLKASVPQLGTELSPRGAETFLEILRRGAGLGPILRQMFDIGVLDLVIPDVAHARCLLQFNQYHSYTVDEHTLRAVEAAAAFEKDDGPVGTAYRLIHDKEILHLALLLHDLGKGYEEDHSEVGRRIAERVAAGLHLPDYQRDALVFLVHKHLRMTHLAFRRDLADPDMLVPFAQEVGSPELLRMLYVLSAADLSAVGPGVFTEWKAELLTELFDGTMVILSGRHTRHDEERRLERIRESVEAAAPSPAATDDGHRAWLQAQLEAFPPHYLSATPPAQIAADLEVIRDLPPREVHVEGKYDPATGTVDYRLITHEEYADGCFHKSCGVLTAKRLEILAAQISTSLDGFVVDSYRVLDKDYDGEVPPERIDEIAEAMRDTLTGQTAVQPLFQRHTRYGAKSAPRPLADQETRVVIDNHSSDRCTVIDVFAHDRPGLLYTISRAIWELGLSVMLAKISTHLDQIVDVFYVTDQQDRKIHDGARLRHIQSELLAAIEEFEQAGHRQFVS